MIKERQEKIEMLYNLTKYPVYLMKDDLTILQSPSSFLALPSDFFHTYKKQVQLMSACKQVLYIVYEHGYIYAFIPCIKQDYTYVWIGPILYKEHKEIWEIQQIPFFKQLQDSFDSLEILHKLPILQENFTYLIQYIYQDFLHQDVQLSELADCFRQDMQGQMKSNLQYIKSKKRELDTRDYNYTDELKLLYHIHRGDILSARLVGAKLTKGRLGQLSIKNSNIPFYAFIALATLISRTAMDSGVDMETAYGLNDIYIQKADMITDNKEFRQLSMDMIVDFCLLVKQTTKHDYPLWVQKCIDFIMRNLHQAITLDMLADEVHMLDTYISVQFKKITGTSIMQYIQEKKIEEAAFLLKSTNTSILDISTLLAFSSQSYFTTVFKNHMGISPSAYRKQTISSYTQASS